MTFAAGLVRDALRGDVELIATILGVLLAAIAVWRSAIRPASSAIVKVWRGMKLIPSLADQLDRLRSDIGELRVEVSRNHHPSNPPPIGD